LRITILGRGGRGPFVTSFLEADQFPGSVDSLAGRWRHQHSPTCGCIWARWSDLYPCCWLPIRHEGFLSATTSFSLYPLDLVSTMVFPILIAIVAAPALLGTQEAIRQSQSKEKREEHRARRCNLIASCVKSSLRSREINGRPIVLKDGKLWVDTGTSDGGAYGHPYTGYYLPYPDSNHEGLVTTITDVAPVMNWVYINKDTYEVKYGVRLDSQPHLTGPFDCTRQDRRLTFESWEGWCAVEEAPTRWALYFDKDDDGLKSKLAAGTRVLEIELTRKEKRWKKDGEERQQDQTTKRAVDTKGEAPVDNPITAQPELSRPGVGVPDEEKAPQPLRPFGLPKSIFSDPPRPLFFGQEMGPPKSPPPAYFQEELVAPAVREIVLPPAPAPVPAPVHESDPDPEPEPVPAPVHEPDLDPEPEPDLDPEPEPERPFTLATSKPVEERSETPPQEPPATSPQERIYRGSAFETPRQAPAPPVGTTPIAPAPLKVSPRTEKRPTPKLNRMSGTRAMSQAQMFEAWATEQTLKNESAIKKPEFRPRSSTTSLSNYSDRPRFDENETIEPYRELKASTPSVSPQPQSEEVQLQPSAPLATSDPAVFARLSSGSSTASDPAVVKDKPVEQESMPRKSLNGQATAASKETLPPLPAGVFGRDSPRRNPSQRESSRPAPLSRRQGSTSARNRDSSPDPPRRRSVTSSRDSPRSTRQASRPTGSREPPAVRARNGSGSSQPRASESPRPPPLSRQRTDPPLQRGERPSPRPPARTNVAPARTGTDRSRTTSSLYREIGDLVGTGRDRSASVASNTSSTIRNGARSEDSEPPLRRTVTAREPRRTESARSASERATQAAQGSTRRGEREPEW
jgi:hypothetical protein